MTFHICVVWENGCRALTEQMLTPEKNILKRKPKKNVMDNKIQNLRRLHRTSNNKRKNKRTHEKRNYEFLIFSEYSFVQLTNMKANAQRIYRKDLWLIPLTQLLIVQRSVINMGKSESRFESSEPACLNTHTSDDKLGKLSWILALFPVTLTPGFYLLLNFGL